MMAVTTAAKDQVVTLPRGAKPQVYTLDGRGYEPTGNGYELQDYIVYKQILVALYEDKVYVQGLSYFFPEAWVVGTLYEDKAVFKSGQLYGTDEEGSVYFVGLTPDEVITDVTFMYHPQMGILEAEQFICENSKKDKIGAFDYFERTVLVPGAPRTSTRVTLPEGLQAEEYHAAANDIMHGKANAEFGVKIAMDGNDVYMQRTSTYVPDGWVKGTMADGKVTFPQGQYIGKFDTHLYSAWDVYFEGAVFDYDAATGTLTSDEGFITSVSYRQWSYVNQVTMTKVEEIAGTPVKPSIDNFLYNEESDAYRVYLDIPLHTTDGQFMNSDKVGYRVVYEQDGEVHDYQFTPGKYHNLTEAMDIIPYWFNDGDWQIFNRGSYFLLFPDDVDSWSRFGIKTVYTGGGETHESEIFWKDINWEGQGIRQPAAEVSTECFDLTGRHAGQGRHGLLIQKTQRADGTVVTRKVVKK